MTLFLHSFFVLAVDYICCLTDPRGGFMHLFCCKLTECDKDKPIIFILFLV